MTTSDNSQNLPTFTVTVKGQPVTFTSAFETLDAAADFLRGQPTRTEFIDSLLHSCNNLRGPSASQTAWIHKLATDAFQPSQRGRFVQGLDLLPIVELLHTAAEADKKHPRIKLPTRTGTMIVLKLAGARSKFPGSVTVTSDRASGDRYFGSIDTAGGFHAGGSCCDDVRDLLTALAANPAHVAGQHGVATDQCCFCSHPLSTAESRSVGYGPDCADRYGLPWGEVSAEVEAAHAAACEPIVEQVAPVARDVAGDTARDILRLLNAAISFAFSKGALGSEVVGAPVSTALLHYELLDLPSFGGTLRECLRFGYLTHNGSADRDLHTVALTAQGLQVLQIGD